MFKPPILGMANMGFIRYNNAGDGAEDDTLRDEGQAAPKREGNKKRRTRRVENKEGVREGGGGGGGIGIGIKMVRDEDESAVMHI